MSTTRKIYAAALRAGSREELAAIITAAETLQEHDVFDAGEYETLAAALSALYWSSYHRRVMVNVA